MSRSRWLNGALLVNLLLPVALVIFATGFFPYKPFLPGIARYDDADPGLPPQAPFDRLIFMVIDALRSDFVYTESTGFKFTQSLIRKGAAIPFTANARSPTITMPRIKAMTTGSIPSFVDVILNFAEGDTTSTLASQDSWVAQMKAKATGKLLMYGDDTWLKLFPATFDRADGTSSFFVSDFTEVDNNVTRHIAVELEQRDWSTMILHYLGLDHIGHKSGPRSVNMVPKQTEMDDVVRQIYVAMEAVDHLSSTLLVVCGDHGMNDAGNHGASSAGETSPALVFISPTLQTLGRKYEAPVSFTDDYQFYSTVEQSDIVPTLGALLGFPVPKNNLGAIIPDFLSLWQSRQHQIQLLMRNARQILTIVSAAFPDRAYQDETEAATCVGKLSESRELACLWQHIRRDGQQLETVNSTWSHSITQLLRKAQMLMSNMASNYDMPKLIFGQLIIAFAAVIILFTLLVNSAWQIRPALAIILPYCVMMFGSSYVEEEHHFWYWATTAWMSHLFAKHLRSSPGKLSTLPLYVLALTATRLMRAWNQTGQKFAGQPDIVKTFLEPHPLFLWLIVGITYSWIYRALVRRVVLIPQLVAGVLIGCLVVLAFCFKLAFTAQDAPELVSGILGPLSRLTSVSSLTTQARRVFAGLGVLTFYAVYSGLVGRKSSNEKDGTRSIELMQVIYALFAMTQSRTTNVPLLLLSHVQFIFLDSVGLSLVDLSTSSVLLQHLSFYASGGSNSIATIDLSNAYNGISGFNVVEVGILTFTSNWAGPIFWTFATNTLLIKRHAPRGAALSGHFLILTLFTACAVASVMAACVVMRTHLFIWTVFSPKYLYCLAWSLGQHLVVNLGVGSVLYWLGLQQASGYIS